IWHDAADDVRRGGFSSTMNYHAFAMPVKGFLVDGKVAGSKFVEMLNDRAESYPAASRFALLNLVDSHDTPRIASMIVNRESRYTEPDVFDYDRDGRGGDRNYKIRKPSEMERRIQRMIALVQATHVGAPMIYYGTEAGMWGADDPDDRMPTTWDDMQFDVQASHPYGRSRPADTVAFDRDLFTFYQRAFDERHKRKVLRRGEFDPIGASDAEGVAAFVRRLDSEAAVVVMNREETAQTITLVKPTTGWSSASVALSSSADGDVRLSDGGETLTIELEPLTAALLVGADTPLVPTGADE
ncbi:MAG: alpha-amylase, partial [Rhodothermia bacterium]|nr:alpha-amylase [Rhodothermia bacterium]